MCTLILVAAIATLPISPGAPRLQPPERRALEHWLRAHPNLSIATEADCGQCSEQIAAVRRGYGAAWPAAPSFHPYYVSGDFNGDGVRDFAVAVLDRSRQEGSFVLLVFNGPLASKPKPAFVSEPLNLRDSGIFFGPPRPKPYRLVVGPFDSDSGGLLIPSGSSYRWDESGEE